MTDPVARARAAALAELRRAPIAVPWSRQAARVAGAWVGVCLLAAVIALGTSLTDGPHLAARAPIFLALLALAAAGGVAALAPARSWAAVVLGDAPLTMAALVVARGAGLPSTTPEWVCSVSHVALGVLPLVIGLWALRQSAWSWPRAVAAGLACGTAGAFLGELACQRGAHHALVHHVGAWLVIAVACVGLSRARRPRTFAP